MTSRSVNGGREEGALFQKVPAAVSVSSNYTPTVPTSSSTATPTTTLFLLFSFCFSFYFFALGEIREEGCEFSVRAFEILTRNCYSFETMALAFN